MSKKANPTVLGFFILLGVALGVGGILLFSSWKIFSKPQRYILYFDASVRGLSPGAPVQFRGVTIGSVVETLIHHNQAPEDTHMPVIIEVDENIVRDKTDQLLVLADKETREKMIERGLRGVLQAQSLVTGVLYVELDIFRDTTPPHYHQVKPQYIEIPTVPTRIQALVENLVSIDFAKTLEQLNATFEQVQTTLRELRTAELSTGLTNLMASLNHVIQSPDFTNSLASLHRTLDEYRVLSEKVRSKLDPLSAGAEGTLKEAQVTLVELRQSLQGVRDLLAPQSALRQDVAGALDELTEAARSVSALADYLNRNPNAVLSGRKRPEPKP